MTFELYSMKKDGVEEMFESGSLETVIMQIMRIDNLIEDYQSYWLIQKQNPIHDGDTIVRWESVTKR